MGDEFTSHAKPDAVVVPGGEVVQVSGGEGVGVFQIGDGDAFDKDFGFPYRDGVVDAPAAGGVGGLKEVFQLVVVKVGEGGAELVTGGLAGGMAWGKLYSRNLWFCPKPMNEFIV